ncbi:MAG: hypothetical protein OEU36_01290 [Gammaproteobacteria bacterium]|nr:hypothetical protein [Gammaproteobacteria bacterium]
MFGLSLRLMVLSLVGTMGVSWLYWMHTAPECLESRSPDCQSELVEPMESLEHQHSIWNQPKSAVALEPADVADLANPRPALQPETVDRGRELQQTWDAAQIQVVLGDINVFGRIGDSNIQDRLSRIPQGVSFPTIIYLHDCALPRWSGPYYFWFGLARSGYVLIAPDSFARTNKSRTCNRGNTQTEMRLEELNFAIKQVNKLPWVDTHNLFLIGHSEGGKAAERYRGSEFKGIVITSTSCSVRTDDGSTTPLLAVASIDDTWVESLGPYCEHADERLLIQGSAHGVLVYPQARQAVRGFIFKHTDVPWT